VARDRLLGRRLTRARSGTVAESARRPVRVNSGKPTGVGDQRTERHETGHDDRAETDEQQRPSR
jgi:hypothetical protein